jgi:hypothetical protein
MLSVNEDEDYFSSLVMEHRKDRFNRSPSISIHYAAVIVLLLLQLEA